MVPSYGARHGHTGRRDGLVALAMLLWLTGATIIVAVYLLFFRKGRQLVRNRGREDLSHDVRALLLAFRSGGTMEVSVRGLEVRFEITKVDELADKATIIIRVPRASWSESRLGELFPALSNAGYEVSISNAKSRTFLEARVPVEEVWAEWSGAGTARAVHLLLDAFSVPKDVRFDLHLSGPANWRWVAHEWSKIRRGAP